MRLRITWLALACALVLSAQGNIPPGGGPSPIAPGGVRAPGDNGSGKPHSSGSYLGCTQSDEINKAEYQKSLDDARELSKLVDDLKMEFEKNDYSVLSLATVKKSEEIEKLSKRIDNRLKHPLCGVGPRPGERP